MGRLTASLRNRLVSVVLVIHATLLPLLYLGLSTILESGYSDLFVNHVRTYSRQLADQLEAVDDDDVSRTAIALLDGAVLSGEAVYAEMINGPNTLRSSLSPVSPTRYPGDDFSFGDHGDQTYYISQAVRRGNQSATLRLGFDETPTAEQITAGKHRALAAILVFMTVSIAASLWLSAIIARPMSSLQQAAERVAGGDFHARMEPHSSIREVRELGHHLERMRQELVGANERLEHEIREHQASERQRIELERRLRHRERIATIGTLAGGIAHEFNNIMTPVLLYAQMALGDTSADSSLAKDLTRIIAAAHRARSLVTRILTFSRDMDLQKPALVALRPVLEEALTLLRDTVPANVEIDFEPRETAPLRVEGDPTQLHQLVINLCVNAWQAMHQTGGRLVLRLTHVDNPSGVTVGPGAYALLEVSDTGHGMDEEVMAHIFEPFFTTREVGEGTGLGLSVVHGIVTSMAGAITVESQVGRGTTFRVYLPMC